MLVEKEKEMVQEKIALLYNKVKNIIYIPPSTGGMIVIDFYIRIMLFLYPLYLSNNIVFLIFQEKSFLYYILTLITGISFIYFLAKKSAIYKKILHKEELFLLIAVILLIAKALIKIFHEDWSIEKEALLWYIVGTYFIVRGFKSEYKYYIRLFLFAAVILYAAFLEYFLTSASSVLNMEIMFQHSGAVPSFLLLASALSACMYCLDREGTWDKFYIFVSGVGFLLLFLYNDMVAICITLLFLLSVPIVFRPTADLIKKNLILCFLFLFIGSSVPLLQIFDWVKLERQYNLEYSVYIDLFLSVIGLLVSQYWTKIPTGRDYTTIVMKKFRGWYIQALSVFGTVCLFCILLGERRNSLPDKWGIQVFKDFANALLQSVQSNSSFVQYLLEEYGIIGCAIWIWLAYLIIKRLIIQWKKTETQNRILCMIGFLFVGQTFLYQMQAETSPIYVILTSFAMCADAVVKKEENESILDESRELIVPETISEESLAEMDKAVENFKAGNASAAVDLSDLE